MINKQLDDIFQIVESGPFSARLGVASGFSILEAALMAEPAIQMLLCLSSPRAMKAVVRRLLILCKEKIDLRYSNPWDLPITAYLWVVAKKDMQLAKTVSTHVAKAENLWWGKYFSDYLMQSATTDSDSQERSCTDLPLRRWILVGGSANSESSRAEKLKSPRHKAIQDFFDWIGQERLLPLPEEAISGHSKNIDSSIFEIDHTLNSLWNPVNVVSESEPFCPLTPGRITVPSDYHIQQWFSGQTSIELSFSEECGEGYSLAA